MEAQRKAINGIVKAALILLTMTIVPAGCGEKNTDEVDRAFSGFNGAYCILVNKTRYELYVFNRKKKVVASYPVAIGLNPDGGGKLYAGDDRTPEGVYYINEILSMDAARDSAAYRKLRAMNEVYFRARDGHYRFGNREKDLGTDAYGPRYFGLNYPNERDVQRYRENVRSGKIKPVRGVMPTIGSGIAIHGNNDPGSVGHRASSGCIRLFNRDIVELERYIRLETPVIIVAY